MSIAGVQRRLFGRFDVEFDAEEMIVAGANDQLGHTAARDQVLRSS